MSADPMPGLADIGYIGSGLVRPECVLAMASGRLLASDATRGIVRVQPDGSVAASVDPSLIQQGFLPNGFALCQDGSFIFANLGEAGGFWRAYADAAPQPFVTEIDGKPVPSANFVLLGTDGRIWLTVSAATRHHTYFTDDCREGYVALVDQGRPRIVAEGVNWTNEVRVSPDGRHLYVNETFSCRTARFDIAANGDLSNRHNIDYPPGTFPDGMAFDANGALWNICVATNRLIRLDADGSFRIVLEDYNEAHFERVREAFLAGRLTRNLLVGSVGRRLSNQTSLAFGGPDLKTLFMGTLTGDRLAAVRMPVAGLQPVHWQWG